MDNYPTRKNRINLRNYRIDECEAKPAAKRYPRLKARSLNVMSSFRKFCNLGDLSGEVGWGKGALVQNLENKRRERASAWHKKRIDSANKVRKALNLKEINAVRTELASYGF